MLGHRALTLEDYTTILKRRWWIIAIPAAILPVVAVAITFFVQPEYVSQTLVLIEQQKVSEGIVKSVIAEDLNSRLASMQEQILSRSRLQPIIERFNLYGTKKTNMDSRIDMVRKDITIRPIQSEIARTNGLPGFFISFKANDASTAQLVCGEITSLFVSENLKSREQSAQGTNEFLDSQLQDAKRSLDDQDSKLADFQRTYVGRLPGEEGNNSNMLVSLNTQLDAATQALTRMQQDRTYVEAMISQQATQNAAPETQRMVPQVQQAELQQLLTQEADLTSRYTADYPDVVTVRRKIRELRAEMVKSPPPVSAAPVATPTRAESPAMQQLRAQLRGMDQGIAQKKHDQAAIEGNVRQYQDRIQSSPMVQEQYKTLTRDYQTAQAFYQELLRKKQDSKMASDLERRQQGEQFRVMDAPNLPDAPSFPKRSAFLFAGLGAGLAFGLFIVAVLEYRDTAVRTERDIWAFTKLPTLAVVAYADPDQPKEAQRRGPFRRKLTTAPPTKPIMNAGS